MIKVYFTSAERKYALCEELLSEYTGAPVEILRTENGKPYLDGNPVYFSLSDSGTRAAVAIADSPVGIDLEIKKNLVRLAVINRFSPREQEEIYDEYDFLKHWTAREAYVKMKGLTIAEMCKHIEFFGGKLYSDGELLHVKIVHYLLGYGVAAVCTEI